MEGRKEGGKEGMEGRREARERSEGKERREEVNERSKVKKRKWIQAVMGSDGR